MPPAGKRRRTCAPPPAVPVVPELPACVLLEIAARTDAATIFRCAATCKLLRREILSADFVRRVCHGPDAVVPSKILGVLGETFTVLHPRTAAAAALEERYLAPFMSRVAAAGLRQVQYRPGPLASRNGLVILGSSSSESERGSAAAAADLCVYDPMSGSRVFLPSAPDIGWDPYRGLSDVHLIEPCALLTAADGVGCSFMLLAADMARNPGFASPSARVRVQTVSSSDFDTGAGWGAVKTTERHPCPRWCTNLDSRSDGGVVAGGVVHWLIHCGLSSAASLRSPAVGEYILTHDVNAGTVGSVDVPQDRRRAGQQREPWFMPPSRLAATPDGKLSFVVADHCVVFVWVLSAGGGSWARHLQIDMMAERGPVLQPWKWMDRCVELGSFSGDRRNGAAVFVWFCGVRYAIDVETGATCATCLRMGGETGIPYEVDLTSRLASMKSF